MINLPALTKILSLILSYGFGLALVLLLCCLDFPGFSTALKYLLNRISWQLSRVLRLSRLLGRLFGSLSRVRVFGPVVIWFALWVLLLLVLGLLVKNLGM